jgi:CheY-like chemotaxis protein/HPt (histidine-containing phosphotransfer) domain-containing protein
MIDVVAVTAHEKNLELTLLVSPDIPSFLIGDPSRLRQILINLVGNAVKFTDRGEVVIQVLLDEAGADRVTLRFEVRDTGIGIPAHRINALFSPFVQADGSTTRKYGGTGLGLAISKQLCELMGGSMGVDSQEGHGATFWFTAVFEKQKQLNDHRDGPPAALQGTRVLVVDPHETSRLALAGMLTSWGCPNKAAADGPSALEELQTAAKKQTPYQIALLNMHLPDMDGAMLASRIKSDPMLLTIKLIMMTNLGQHDDIKQLKEIGCCGYLTKPTRKAQLQDCLTVALNPKQACEGHPSARFITRRTIAESLKRGVGILLVDDNLTNQQVALAILETLGYRADVVTNGEEALEALTAKPYDLVFMDCQMPRMDGYEATRQIRSWGRETGKAARTKAFDIRLRASGIPIVAMTAHAMKDDREKCLSAGMNDFITKPISPAAVADALDRWLVRQQESDDWQPETTAASDDRVVSPPDERTITFDRKDFFDRLMGDADLAMTVIAGFLEDIPKQMTELRATIERGDSRKAGDHAHKIKGAAANMGGSAMSGLASAMEIAGRTEDIKTMMNLMPDLEAQFERLKTELQKEQ